MGNGLKEKIKEYLNDRVTDVGFAPVDRFDDAPDKHHPANVCKDAKTVIVLGVKVPRGILSSPHYDLHVLHRSYHSVYPLLDEVALGLCNFIEDGADGLAVPIPSYAPLVFHGLEPWGIISLKHAAVRAGLGSFGVNGLVHNPECGTLLRLGAVVTSAELPGDSVIEDDPCPSGCTLCQQACPTDAIGENGTFLKDVCMQAIVKHAIYPLALKDEEGFKNIERIINTAGYNYWLTCDECLKACLNNSPKGNRRNNQGDNR